MSDKHKKRVRELAAKVGVSYQAADNMLRAGRETPHRLASVGGSTGGSGGGGDRMQVIRSFHTETGHTFSARCSVCSRWIWCGDEERQGVCQCGNLYGVVFDLEPDWTLPMGARCMDCGAEHRLTQSQEGRNPWHTVNHGQMLCNLCFVAQAGSTNVSRSQGGASAVASPPTLQAVVASSPVVLDWRAFVLRLTPEETGYFRHVFDHEHGPLATVWGDLWDTLVVDGAHAFGVRLTPPRAQQLLSDLVAFGVLRVNRDASPSTASPSYKLTSFFIASSKAVGNWFDLGGLPPSDERVVVTQALQGIRANLAWYSGAAAHMSAGERISASARLMGQLIGARSRHPGFAKVFEELRLEHNRVCPVEARVRVLRAAS